jgi:2-polyprenyl-3-methyl-5-hydroxy-6-metoxy-1,4-benzoquinol methylase
VRADDRSGPRGTKQSATINGCERKLEKKTIGSTGSSLRRSDPRMEKLPHFGLPESMSGMRVLDIGCAEGFFSFEAERRGAREVIGLIPGRIQG